MKLIKKEIEMATSQEEISEWFDRGLIQRKDFMIIVCDTFSYEDYPIYCSRSEVIAKHKSCNAEKMQTVMEVYDLSMDKKTQLNAFRCLNLPKE